MERLPREIHQIIGRYLTTTDLYSTHYILRSEAIEHLQFPLHFPVKRTDCQNLCRWLWRWRKNLSGVRSIHLTYFDIEWRASLFEILCTINIESLQKLYIIHMLSLFDQLSPQLMIALRAFMSRHDVRQATLDARLYRFSSFSPETKLKTFSGITSRTIFYKDETLSDQRESPLDWITNICSPLEIKCWCFQTNGICRTRMRLPTDVSCRITIIHR